MSSYDASVTLTELRLFLGRLAELGSQDRQAFLASWRDQEAAQMLITKLAEATTRLPEAVLATWPDMPWQQIRGMRNRLVHAYHAVDLDVLWETVNRDVPQLLAALGPP